MTIYVTNIWNVCDIIMSALGWFTGTTNDLLLEKVQENEEINQKVEFLEKKPWRKAGKYCCLTWHINEILVCIQ